MTEPSPLSPRWTLLAPLLAGAAACGALLLLFALPTLRQARLLDEAVAVCLSREAAANHWLEREETVATLLEGEREAADSGALLDAEASSELRETLAALAERHGMRLEGVRLGTRRAGEPLDTVPASVSLVGDRAGLPELLDAFYRQPRVIRLVALDLELPRFGEPTLRANLRWEFAAEPVSELQVDDPASRWSPPALLADARPAAIHALNRDRWDRLEERAIALRSLAPRMRRLAAMDAERARREEQRLAVLAWREASASESQAVQRRLPELLRRMDLSATGEAALHPGPGGLVVADEG